MSFLLVADRPHTLPFVERIEEESVEQAMLNVVSLEESEGYIYALFLIDLDSGEAMRMVRDGEGGWSVTNSAYEKNLGVKTELEV